MDANLITALVGLLVAVIAAAPGMYALILQRRRDKRDEQRAPVEEAAAGIGASASAAEALKSYSDEINNLRDELGDLRHALQQVQANDAAKDRLIAEWQMGIERLIGQIVSLGHQPVWKPRPVEARKP